MVAFTRSASATRSTRLVTSGIALLGASALVLAGCSADTGDTGTGSGDNSAVALDCSVSSNGTFVPEFSPVSTGATDLTYKIGTALPVTGNLAFLGPPEIAGTEYAASQINAAGKGITIDLIQGDSGDTDNKAYETEVPRVLGAGATAVIGAASSGTSLQFIDQVVGAGAIQFSPANTSAAFTGYEDDGLYFRTAPSDVLQGEVLGNLIAADGAETLGLVVLNDSYGTGLACFTKDAFEAAGGEVVAAQLYNTGDTNFTAQLDAVLATDPDAIALITFEEVKTMIPDLVASYPADKLYFVDGNLSNFGDQFPAGTLEGAKGTLPGLTIDTIEAFTSELNGYWTGAGNAELTEFSYAAESYDAVTLLALAALKAGSTAGPDVAAWLAEVSGGTGGGTKCFSFAECADIILAGGVADYDGVSGPISFNEYGDPTEASIGTYVFGNDNTYSAYNG